MTGLAAPAQAAMAPAPSTRAVTTQVGTGTNMLTGVVTSTPADVAHFSANVEKMSSAPVLVGDEAAAFVSRAQDRVKSGVTHLTVSDNLLPEQSRVIRLSDGGTMTTIPIVGSAVTGSTVGVQFNIAGQITEVTEIQMHSLDKDSGRVQVWRNGVQTVDVIARAPAATAGFSWSKLNSCLSNAGIASWVIAALSVACGAACVGTGGLGCIPCLVAASGATGGVIGYCVTEASH